jgi:hypothetical protein
MISFLFHLLIPSLEKQQDLLQYVLINMLLLELVCFDQLKNVSRTSSARNFYSSRSHFAFLECRCLRNAGDLHIFRQLLILSYFLKIILVHTRYSSIFKLHL